MLPAERFALMQVAESGPPNEKKFLNSRIIPAAQWRLFGGSVSV